MERRDVQAFPGEQRRDLLRCRSGVAGDAFDPSWSQAVCGSCDNEAPGLVFAYPLLDHASTRDVRLVRYVESAHDLVEVDVSGTALDHGDGAGIVAGSVRVEPPRMTSVASTEARDG